MMKNSISTALFVILSPSFVAPIGAQDKDDTPIAVSPAQSARDQQRLDQSEEAKIEIAALNAQIAQNPKVARAYLQRAQQWERVLVKGFVYETVGDTAAAQSDYLKALELDPKLGEARARLAASHMKKAAETMRALRDDKTKTYQEPEAVAQIAAELERAIRDDPNFAPAYDWAAHWAVTRIGDMRLNMMVSEAPFFAGFAEKDPTLVQQRLGRALDWALGAKTRAKGLPFDYARDLVPATRRRVMELRSQKQFDKALPLSESLAVLLDKDPNEQAMLAQLRLAMNDPKTAMLDIDRAIALAEKAIPTVVRPGMMPPRLTPPSPAVVTTRSENRKSLARFYALRAQTRLAFKTDLSDEAALLDLQKAVALSPSEAHLFQVMSAQILLKHNLNDKALEALNAAAKVAPFHAPTFELRAPLLRALMRVPEAEADEKRLLEIAESEKEAARIRQENGL